VPGDLDGEAAGGSTGWSGGGASNGKRLAEDRDEVGEEERMAARRRRPQTCGSHARDGIKWV
jgi:hypothetical protein